MCGLHSEVIQRKLLTEDKLMQWKLARAWSWQSQKFKRSTGLLQLNQQLNHRRKPAPGGRTVNEGCSHCGCKDCPFKDTKGHLKACSLLFIKKGKIVAKTPNTQYMDTEENETDTAEDLTLEEQQLEWTCRQMGSHYKWKWT